ncbi:MAG: NADP-dependent oxidoreductase [Bdellovibrionota bacterium]
MRAIRIQTYGGAEQLRMDEVPRPEMGPDQVLVKIHDAGINPIDWKIREGVMKEMRPATFPLTMGQDFAGEIEELGSEVKNFNKGDRVFGFANGSYAEYAAVSARQIARIPERLSFAAAASIPTAALTAYQILTDVIMPAERDVVLIHGAAGGVGSFAVQIAAHMGANVVAVASVDDESYLKKIGATKVIDYHTQKFEESMRDVSAVIDLVGGDASERSYGILKKGGVLVSTVGAADAAKGKKLGIRAVSFVMKPDGAGLEALATLAEEGVLQPRLQEVLPLSEAGDAQERSKRGGAHGKVVLEVIQGGADS